MGGAIFLCSMVLLIGAWAVVKHNNFVNLRNLVAESWRQIDVELRRRYDLIPNLVRVVEAYAQHERNMLLLLTQARAAAMELQALPDRATAESNLDQAVNTVLARAEFYPPLQASRQFMDLQRELAETENRIAAGRRIYNGNVRSLNTSLKTFPGSIIGSMMGIEPAAYFGTHGEVSPGNGTAELKR